ncbi:MAG TPA: TlyA family RNA methyltransferase [Bdellovibrionota bacterium]|nr:TlyA family RNA methyltransferase [Bdellovibrionota bacterium]
MKKRLDVLIVERGLAATRSRAQALVLAGNVLIDDVPVTKAGQPVPEDAAIRIRGEVHPYVSRGGVKLAAALDSFAVSVTGRTALDIGASTGGFTEVLLLRGATRVYAVDVGHNQMDWKIRQDPRVAVFENVNARHLEFGLIGQKVGIIVADVSFISLDKIFPAALQFSTPETDWITLIKPQFEVGKQKVGKGGIVNSEEERQKAVERLTDFGKTLGLIRVGLIESPITGTQGNKEFLAHWKQR